MNVRKKVALIAVMILATLTGCAKQNRLESASLKQTGFSISKYTKEYQDTKPETALDENSTLQDYLTLAAMNNPLLESSFNQFKASAQQIPQAGALDDPKFTYKYFIEEVETRVGPQRQSFGIAQTFPWFGKLQLKEDRAALASKIKWYNYQKTKLHVFYEVKNAFFEYLYLSRAIDITSQNIDLLKQFYQIASSRYTAALADHPDVVRAQLELARVEDRLISLKQLKTPLAARLNASLNRPAQTPIPFPKTPDIDKYDMDLSTEEILTRLTRANPDLKTADLKVKLATADISLTKKENKPSFTLGLTVIDTSDMIGPTSPSDDGKDPLIAMLSLNLPLWADKNNSRLSQARLTRTAAVQSKQNMQNTLSAQTEMEIYKFQDAQRKLILYRDNLMPIAKEALKVTQQSFQSGSGSFTDLIDAQRLLLEYQLALERAAADTAISIAQINKLIGTDYQQQKTGGDKNEPDKKN